MSWPLRRKVFLLLSLVSLASVILWRILQLPRARDESWRRIWERGALRVGLDPSFPPFVSLDGSGKLVGYDVELARELGRRLELEVAFVTSSFDGLYGALQAERFDCIISSVPYDPYLTQDVGYSHPYFDAGQVLVITAAQGEIGGVRDLAGREVGVEMGSEGHMEAMRLARRLESVTLAPYSTPQEVIWAVREGRIQAAIIDSVSAYEFIARWGGVKTLIPMLTREPYVIVVRFQDRALLRKINQALQAMEAEGYLRRLYGSY